MFDTVSIDVKTKVFQDLGVHLERLATSASMAFIPFPKRLHSLELVEKVVKETVRCAFEERERRGFVTSSESSMQARFYLCSRRWRFFPFPQGVYGREYFLLRGH